MSGIAHYVDARHGKHGKAKTPHDAGFSLSGTKDYDRFLAFFAFDLLFFATFFAFFFAAI